MATEKVSKKESKTIPYVCAPREPRRCVNNPGERYRISAKLSVDPVSGKKIAEPGEKIDLHAYIQASKASTDITTIVAKLKAGDESVINVRPGFYGDTTLLPKDINDINAIEKLNAQARQSFDKLPDEIRALFNNDPSAFFSAVLDQSAETVIKNYVASQSSKTDKIVTEETDNG